MAIVSDQLLRQMIDQHFANCSTINKAEAFGLVKDVRETIARLINSELVDFVKRIGKMKNNYALALEALAEKQREWGRPPKNFNNVRIIVKNIIIRCGLRGDPRERYFRLLATCAILGKEPMYNAYKPKPKKKKVKK